MKRSGVKVNKYVNYLNERGFTMVDALYGFTIFILIMSFMPLAIHHITQSADVEQTASDMEWTVFLQLLKKEVRMSEDFMAAGEVLTVTKDDQNITYESYGTNVRRRVNGTGHEIVLQNVEHVTYEDQGNRIKLSLTDINKHERSAVVTPFILVEKVNADEE